MLIVDITIAYGLGTIGMIAHWAKRWEKGETVATLSKYILTNKLATVKAIFGTLIGVSGALATGADYATLNGIALLVMAGYGSDSIFNKDTEEVG